jgi:hypothetical protein
MAGSGTVDEQWDVYITDEVDQWLSRLAGSDEEPYLLVNQAIQILATNGPTEGRPLVDRVKGSAPHNLKELRPGSRRRSEIRVLFMFDPWRAAIVLVAGDKAGDWTGWYERNIPRAEALYSDDVSERQKEVRGA